MIGIIEPPTFCWNISVHIQKEPIKNNGQIVSNHLLKSADHQRGHMIVRM